MMFDPSRLLIVTADDFGRDPSVNAAVGVAARHGILTCASLMMTSPFAADAVALARTLPGLRVGLHLVLTDGHAALSRSELPDLLDADGRFVHSMTSDAFRMFASARIRRQVAAEIRAQFEAFRATRLALDHVNAHKHFHLHPTLLRLMLEIGADYGLRAVRLPREPAWFARLAGRGVWLGSICLRPWLRDMHRTLQARGVTTNDQIFGIACTGHLDEARMLAILGRLPTGVSEIYLHPTVAAASPGNGPRDDDELRALISPRVRAAVQAAGLRLGGYSDLPT